MKDRETEIEREKVMKFSTFPFGNNNINNKDCQEEHDGKSFEMFSTHSLLAVSYFLLSISHNTYSFSSRPE